jgi:serine acetyltransferase
MSALRADARTYCQLRFPSTPLALALPLVWTTSPGLWRLAVHRFCHNLDIRRREHGRTPLNFVLMLLAFALHRLIIVLTKVDTAPETIFEPGVYVSDRGNIVLGAVRVGAGARIHHRVTIGMRPPGSTCPTIGANVWIGPDCIVTGEISIGAGCTLLPGTVVSRDVPPGCLMQGNPARVVQRNYDNAALRATLRWRVEAKDIVTGQVLAS